MLAEVFGAAAHVGPAGGVALGEDRNGALHGAVGDGLGAAFVAELEMPPADGAGDGGLGVVVEDTDDPIEIIVGDFVADASGFPLGNEVTPVAGLFPGGVPAAEGGGGYSAQGGVDEAVLGGVVV